MRMGKYQKSPGRVRRRGSPRNGRSFFFFQAEDGIRDYKVTGVQTCALPISRRVGRIAAHDLADASDAALIQMVGEPPEKSDGMSGIAVHAVMREGKGTQEPAQIGRASCRERV